MHVCVAGRGHHLHAIFPAAQIPAAPPHRALSRARLAVMQLTLHDAINAAIPIVAAAGMPDWKPEAKRVQGPCRSQPVQPLPAGDSAGDIKPGGSGLVSCALLPPAEASSSQPELPAQK